MDERTIEVEEALFAAAAGGDRQAMVFWLKNRAPGRWSEKPDGAEHENSLLRVDVILGKLFENV